MRIVDVADFRIGVCHGHQVSPWGDPLALAALARKLDVDVLVSGHTHVSDIVEYEGRCFVNPGSITGAYSPQAGEEGPAILSLLTASSTLRQTLYSGCHRQGAVSPVLFVLSRS
jgi:vacuolar protein sorting-associated protein 29